MIKCKDKCPNGIFEGCCVQCPERETCSEVCSDVVKFQTGTCEHAIEEGTELQVFESQTTALMVAISNIASQKKALDEEDKKMREQLEAAMEQYGVKSFENELLKITYVEPTTRTSVDSTKLKKQYPDIYNECSKTSEVKGSVRITVK